MRDMPDVLTTHPSCASWEMFDSLLTHTRVCVCVRARVCVCVLVCACLFLCIAALCVCVIAFLAVPSDAAFQSQQIRGIKLLSPNS